MDGSVLILSFLQLIKALVPADSLDSSDVLLEVVSGRTTGGKKDNKCFGLHLFILFGMLKTTHFCPMWST